MSIKTTSITYSNTVSPHRPRIVPHGFAPSLRSFWMADQAANNTVAWRCSLTELIRVRQRSNRPTRLWKQSSKRYLRRARLHTRPSTLAHCSPRMRLANISRMNLFISMTPSCRRLCIFVLHPIPKRRHSFRPHPRPLSCLCPPSIHTARSVQ